MTKTTTVKKAFAHMGISKSAGKDEPLKTMNEEAVFVCLMNWIINQMPTEQQLTIRFKAQGIYEIILTKRRRFSKEESLVLLTEEKQSFVLYEWDEEVTYRNLTKKNVEEVITRADSRNSMNDTEDENYDTWITEEVDEETKEITNEDLELIHEFLEV